MEWFRYSPMTEQLALKLMKSLPSEPQRWRETAYAHWINRLMPASIYLPEPQRSWYMSGYKPQVVEL